MHPRTTTEPARSARALLAELRAPNVAGPGTPAANGGAIDPDDAAIERAALALAEELARETERATTRAERARRALLARLATDPDGQAFTTSLTDRAYRSRDPVRVVDAARQLLRTLGVPRYLPPTARAQLKLLLHGGPFVPELAARGLLRRLRNETRDVVLDAAPEAVRAHLAQRHAESVRVNLNYLGEAVLGEAAAAARCEQYLALLARPEVRAISVKLSSIVRPFELLAWDAALAELRPRLRSIYRTALEHRYPGPAGPTPKLVSLDMEAYRDLELTFELFRGLLDEPELLALPACLVLQAYLPDAYGLQRELTRWAQARIARGGAPVRLRIVKGANLAAERVESAARGWKLPIFGSKGEVDANFKRMLELGCQPDNARAVQLGIASHNLFDIALGLVLRARHGVEAHVGFELLEGMADPLRRVLQGLADDVLVYCPIVDADSMETAIAYLTRRLDENMGPENFLRQSFAMHVGDAAFRRERERFRDAFARRHQVRETPLRDQDRGREAAEAARAETAGADAAGAVRSARADSHDPPVRDRHALTHDTTEQSASRVQPPANGDTEQSASRAGFTNEPDTDFALAANRRWITAILERWQTREPFELPPESTGHRGERVAGFDPSRPGFEPYHYVLAREDDIEAALERASAAAARHASTSAAERDGWLAAIAAGLRRERGELIAAMVLDAGKRVEQADIEISEAIDFAEFYRRSYLELAGRPELRLSPRGTVLVTPPWNFPLAIPTSGVLAGLMAGNAVILKPALETVLVAERLASICWRAGVPRELLQLVICADELGSRLVQDARVSTIVLTGASSTARLFQQMRPGVRLLAETGGKNSVIVTAAADRDAVVKDVLHSAFGHAGQKCSAASLLICEAEVYDDPRFREILADAVRSLQVGPAWDLRSMVTPLIAPPSAALARGISQLEPGERWLVQPRIHPENPRLVTPGVKLDVAAGSFTHQTELFGPVLAMMRAEHLDHALELANGTPYGLTAGLFSLDEREQVRWAERMQSGNLYVNRAITGAVVGRQPFGGAKASSFGPGAKAGGPNYVLQLCRIEDAEERAPDCAPAPAAAQLLGRIRRQLTAADLALLSRAACVYAHAHAEHFAKQHDPSRLPGERNLFRYRACGALLIRASAGAALGEALLACIAGLTAGASLTLSVHPQLAADRGWLGALPGVPCFVEDETAAAERASRHERVRQIGELEPALLASAERAGVHVAREPVLRAGRVELLHYVREQTLSVLTHRYGSLHADGLCPFE